MAGAMRKAMVYLGLVEEDEHYDDIDDYDDEPTGSDEHRRHAESRSPEPARSVTALRTEPRTQTRHETRGALATMPERRPQPVAAERVMDRIITIHPRSYNEAKQIGESFRDATPVIMNLTDMADVDAKRLVDFAAGLVFGLHGTIERVTNKVFLLSPVNVTVTAEDKARMAETSFFNQS
jgi:cell division inhibitor SepF